MNRKHRKNRKNRAVGSTNKRPLSESSSLVFGNLDEEPDFPLPPPEPPPPEPPPPDPSSEPLLSQPQVMKPQLPSRTQHSDHKRNLAVMQAQLDLPTIISLHRTTEGQLLNLSGDFDLYNVGGYLWRTILSESGVTNAINNQLCIYSINDQSYDGFRANYPDLSPGPRPFPAYGWYTLPSRLSKLPRYQTQTFIQDFFPQLLQPTLPSTPPTVSSSLLWRKKLRQSHIHDFFFPSQAPCPSSSNNVHVDFLHGEGISSILHLDLRETSDNKGETLSESSSSPIGLNPSIHPLDLREPSDNKVVTLYDISSSPIGHNSSIHPPDLRDSNSFKSETISDSASYPHKPLPTYTERLSTLCQQFHSPFHNLFSLQHEIIELENEFYSLSSYLPPYPSEEDFDEYSMFYNSKESVLKEKYRFLVQMRELDIYNPENICRPYNPSLTYHIYNGHLRLITYTHTQTAPLIIKCERYKWGGQKIIPEDNVPMLGEGKHKKKAKLDLRRGEGNGTQTLDTRYTFIPPPLSQLSAWVQLPLPKTNVFHFTPYTQYSLASSTTCQIGFSYCCHKFCLPTQSQNAFSLSFLPSTGRYTSSLSLLPLPPTLLLAPSVSNTPALIQCDTYNSSNPFAVWTCSNCSHDNFFCLTDNICCYCRKPRHAPNLCAPQRILFHDPEYPSDDDTTTTPFHYYTTYDDLAWDTTSEFSSEESEVGSMSSVDFPQHTHTIPSIPLPSCHMHSHKHMHTQPQPPIISTPLPDTVRATHTLNFLLQRPTPPSTIVKGYRLHVQTTIIPSTPYTLTSQTPAYTPHVTLYTCPLALFVHKHICLVRTSLALHITLLHNTLVAQSHANLYIAMKTRTIHTQRPVCFARNPSYASSSSVSTCFYSTVFLLFYHFLLPFHCFSSCFPHTALVVGIG
jgi:hypothetical protein